MVFSNIVRKDEMREIQLKALKEIAEALTMSFGPMGSNTLIIKDGACNRYTKDGYSILKEIKLTGAIEHSITEDLVDITRGIVKELGDNTTGAVIMSYLLFKEMTKLESEERELPFDIINNFKKAVALVSDQIEGHGRECTLDDIYDIAFTSTNGNADIATKMKTIYEEYGMDVFIDVNVSNTGEDLIKEYDGMTLDAGYADTAFINNKAKGVATIKNAKVYAFNDPVDTPEMMTFFDAIIHHNIYDPWQNHRMEDVVPTVIMATRISRDLSAYMEQLISFMYRTPEAQRPPLLIITNIVQEEQFLDIARMCNCKLIKKYISAEQQKKDTELGLAPTPATVHTFCGWAEEIESSVARSKFINPIGMDDTEDYVFNCDIYEEFNTTQLNNPKVYAFTALPESPVWIAQVLAENILVPFTNQEEMVPTVILVPSMDLAGDEITYNLKSVLDIENAPIIMAEYTDTNIDALSSIIDICKGRLVRKFTDSVPYEEDDKHYIRTSIVEPGCNNIQTWFPGTAESVIVESGKIKFIHPEATKNEDGTYTSNYSSLIQFVEGQIKSAIEDGQDAHVIGTLKRRLNSLKSNMVEFLVGGVSASDRDSLRDLVEDAVLNCRSSAANGVGYGANFEGFRATYDLVNSNEMPDGLEKYIMALHNAYLEVTELLYTTVHDENTAKVLIDKSLEFGMPYNLRARKFDGLVLTSIKSDVVTLSTISKILGLMITCNQSLLQNPLVNTYYSQERTEKALNGEFEMAEPVDRD